MIASFRSAAIRTLTRLLGRTRFRYDGGTYTVFEGVLNPTLFRASLIFTREALAVSGLDSIDILELGSGSGLASVALARRGHQVTAVDSSLKAATNTAVNALNNAVNVRTVCSDWDTALKSDLSFDLVVTNPPFLSSPTPILNEALFGGPDLAVVEAALKAASQRLRTKGRILLLTSDRSGRAAVLQAIQSSGLNISFARIVHHWGEILHIDHLGVEP